MDPIKPIIIGVGAVVVVVVAAVAVPVIVKVAQGLRNFFNPLASFFGNLPLPPLQPYRYDPIKDRVCPKGQIPTVWDTCVDAVLPPVKPIGGGR